MQRKTSIILLVLGLAMLLGCKREGQGPRYGARPPSSNATVYLLAVHPLHNPAKLMQAYQPLIDHLNGQLEHRGLGLEASRDYANFEEKYGARSPAFLLPNPWQTLQAMKVGYHVIATAGDAADFKGIFIVRKDSGIRKPDDLKGKAVSYPSPTALAACIMPQYFLHSRGIDVRSDIENRYVGSQESSIMNVFLKKTASGATWPPPWRAFQKEHPREAAELEVVWETEPLINNSVMVRDDVPPEFRDQVRSMLTKLHEYAQGRSILLGMETSRFTPASDGDYDQVRSYIARFEREVRPVKVP